MRSGDSSGSVTETGVGFSMAGGEGSQPLLTFKLSNMFGRLSRVDMAGFICKLLGWLAVGGVGIDNGGGVGIDNGEFWMWLLVG